MCTTALPQIAFSLTKRPPFFPDTAPVMRGALSDCLYLACEIFKSSYSWWKPPPSLLDPCVTLCIAHPSRTNKIRDTGVEVRCEGSTSHLQSTRCMLPGHWSEGNHFFPGAPSSRSIFRAHSKYCGLGHLNGRLSIDIHVTVRITQFFTTRQVNSRSLYYPAFCNQLAHPTLLLMIVQRLDNGQAVFS